MGWVNRRAVAVFTGSRHRRTTDDWRAVRFVFARLAAGTLIIHGGAPGIDTIVNDQAVDGGFVIAQFPYVDAMGPKGGPYRNHVMAEVAHTLGQAGHPVTVYAFPLAIRRASPGTWGMIARCKALGLTVVENVPDES